MLFICTSTIFIQLSKIFLSKCHYHNFILNSTKIYIVYQIIKFENYFLAEGDGGGGVGEVDDGGEGGGGVACIDYIVDFALKGIGNG